MQIFSVNAGYIKLDGGAMYGVVPKSIWQKFHVADANNMCSLAMRCLLIADGSRLILIDNGIGDKQDAVFFSRVFYQGGNDTLHKSLNQHGFSADDITDVFLTHLHFDHCGGSIIRQGNQLVPAFKNAMYWSNAQHWQCATKPNDREKASFLTENILPIQQSGQLQFQPKDVAATSFSKNIHIRYTYGHTQAMMLPMIQYKQHTIAYVADLLPCVGHIPIPYVAAYDMQPLLTMQEKKSFLQEAVSKEYILFFEHDPQHECCTVQQTEKGIRVKETFAIKTL